MAPVADAQVNPYSFAVGSDPYVALSGATTFSISGGGGTADDGYSALQPIGFTFNFGGTGFTQFSMHSNGWLRLGATASATDYSPMDNTTMNNLIVFNGRDLNNSGAVYSYLLEGTAGNYICKIQANNFYRYNTTSHLGNAQIWLYEATGVVEIRYGTYATTWTSGTCQVGIRTTNADIKKVVSTTWAGVTAGSTDGVANTAGITQATTNQVVSGTLFSFTPPSPCTGTPAPGATTGPASVGSGETVNLGLQNTTPGTGVTYQWYVSTVSSGGPWTAGGTNATYSPTQTVQSWYYCDVTCGANTGSSTVHQVDISYCTSTSTSQASYFSNFATTGGLTNITNASGASAGGYGDFTAQSVSQSANSSVSFTTGLVGTTVGVAIWVDWNNDLVFDDILSPAGEKMYNTGAYVSSASGSFTVPAATPAGNYRMRIRMDWNAQNPTPCGNISRGETEDYTFTVAPPPACPAPSALSAINATSSGADLGWTENGSATAWDLEIGTTGFTPTGTPTVNDAGANPYTWSGGAPATTYQFYVRADCGMDNVDVSAWMGPFSFTTSCTVLTVPYTQDFEGTTGTSLPTCWSLENVNGGTTWLTAAYTGFGSTRAAKYGYDGTLPGNDWLYSPGLALTGGTSYTVEYSMVDPSTSFPEAMDVFWGSAAAAGSMTNLIADHTPVPVTTPVTVSYAFTPGSSGTYYIGWHSKSGADEFDFYLDDISVVVTPSCLAPSALGATSITAAGADLGWTENGTATAWDLEIGTNGFTPTGTPTLNDVGANPYTWAGGSANTAYDFYVRADCGMDNVDVSTWEGPYSFTTLCTSFAAPYHEGFDVSSSNPPGCWSISAGAGDGWRFNGPTGFNTTCGAPGNGSTGTGSFAWIDLSSPADANVLLNAPLVDVSALTNPQLRFDRYMCATSNAPNPLYVEYYDGAVWQLLQSFTTGTATTGSNAAGWQEEIVNLSSAVSGGIVQIRFRGEDGGGPSSFNGDVGLDEIYFEEAPACPAPTALSATNVTSSGADLGWTENGSASAWDIEIGANGFTPTGTPTLNDVGANPYTWAGGSANTAYDFYVRADCGMDNVDVSAWVGPYSFNTLCNAF
ncbi:MAG: hypothetical protein KDC01_01100, partial [Flavobacteriales bacterium]|nr:hypothetical protein [Flavobacteriales bacterium]